MLVKVVNDNMHPYTEKYKGQTIHIPARGSITMDLNEASHFLGTNPGVAQMDAGGQQKPETFKMLRIERMDAVPRVEPETKKFVCAADGKEFQTQAALEAHIAENYMDRMVDEDAKKKLKARTKKGLKDDTSTNSDSGEAQV